MTTSAVVNITTNKNKLLKSVLHIAGICGVTQTPRSEDLNLAAEFMNDILKRWQENACELWSIHEAQLILTPNQVVYDFTDSDTICAEDITRTTLGANLAVSTTTVTVASTENMALGRNIVIRLDDGTVHRTTVVTVPTTTTITIAAGIGASLSAASSGNAVFVYPGDEIHYPLGIAKAYFNTSTNFDQQVEVIGMDDYYDISNKLQSGVPTVCYFDRKNDQSYLYTWPIYSGDDGLLKILYRRQIEIMVNSADTFDFPQQGLLPLKLQVAALMALTYEYDQKSTLLEKKGLALEERFFKDMEETTSITITPDFGDYA